MSDIPTVPQLSRDDLAGMKPAEILKARGEGRLAEIMGQSVPLSPSEGQQLSATDLKKMTPEQIVAAKAAGNLDDLLGRAAN